MSKTSDLTKKVLNIETDSHYDVNELHDRIGKEVGISEAKHVRHDRRHAELAALVQKMTVALEALEKKVEKLVRLELENAGLKPDPPDIKDVPTVDWVRGPRPDAPRGPRGGTG